MAKVVVKNNINEFVLKLKKVTEQGLETSALLVESSALEMVPVDTGRLRASITHITEPTEARVGTNVEYAEDIEFGGSRKAPKGFLRPALDENRSKIIRIMSDSIKELEQ